MSVILDMRSDTFTYTCDYCDPGRDRPVTVKAGNYEPLSGWVRRRSSVHANDQDLCPDCAAKYPHPDRRMLEESHA